MGTVIDAEALRADLDWQAAWCKDEMALHSHGKTHGYPEKKRRLGLEPSDNQSVMHFMSMYWGRFHDFWTPTYEDPTGTDKDLYVMKLAIQQHAKVPNGLVDKVGVHLWMIDGEPAESDYRGDEAVDEVVANTLQTVGPYTQVDYDAQIDIRRFDDTILAEGLRRLHHYRRQENLDAVDSLQTAIIVATDGMLVWHAFNNRLRAIGLDPTPPQPGLPSGEVKPWER